MEAAGVERFVRRACRALKLAGTGMARADSLIAAIKLAAEMAGRH